MTLVHGLIQHTTPINIRTNKLIYKNISGKSGIHSYEIGLDYIIITFKSGIHRTYIYTYESAGPKSVEAMKSMAEKGIGLNSFITKCVSKKYAHKY